MGDLILYVSFITAFGSSIFYFASLRGKKIVLKSGRQFFYLAVLGTMASAGYLLYLIITHQFQYTYVWDYSSRDLPLGLLMSTFYAGQEGSFHLWALLMAIIGFFLVRFLVKKDSGNEGKYEAPVMGLFTLIQSFLIFILILKSPYKFVWESFPKDVQLGFMPQDGRGLNPLLQNFWMIIHPPILFAGFSSLAVPFCFAVAALIKNKYDKWVKLASPWTLFAAMVLGAGIMLGGYWAYGVLGWGGYWGWDPVENSSLVPWIIIVAGIHTMVTQDKTGKFKKTNLLLCIFAFALVLYSTFLTRSGILGDSSVHSFVDPGQLVYLFLIAFVSLFTLLGVGLIIYRLKSLRTENGETANIFSRESALYIGSITLCASALVIAVGTSWPILSKATIDAGFYNKMNLPLAIMIAVINGLSLLLNWKYSEKKAFLKSLYVPLGLTAATTIFLAALGVTEFLVAVFAASTFFAIFINLQRIYRVYSKNRAFAGGAISHAGILILFLGVISTGKFSQEANVSLPLDQPKNVLGYTMTYKGSTPVPGDEQKYNFNVVVEKDGQGFLLQPVMFYSDYSQGITKNPDIANLGYKDIYLSPMSLEQPGDTLTDGNMSSQANTQTLVLTASIKPMINLVWGGTLIMTIGFFLSITNKVRQNKIEKNKFKTILTTNGVNKNHKKKVSLEA